MALEINNIYRVICLKGNVSNSHVQEVKGYFKALLTIEDSVNINICEVKKGTKKLKRVLDSLKNEIADDKSLIYYGNPEPAVKELYARFNHPSNFYQAA